MLIAQTWLILNFTIIIPAFVFTGERLEEKECDQVLKDCLDPEDDEGFVPYVRKYQFTNDKLHRSSFFYCTNDFRHELHLRQKVRGKRVP